MLDGLVRLEMEPSSQLVDRAARGADVDLLELEVHDLEDGEIVGLDHGCTITDAPLNCDGGQVKNERGPTEANSPLKKANCDNGVTVRSSRPEEKIVMLPIREAARDLVV